MQHLDLNKLKPLAGGEFGCVVFETGTFLGRSARFLAEHFPRVITIELSEALHASAKASLADLPNVECLHGNSSEVLARLLPDFSPQTGFFFLDAHWSGDQTVDWQNSRWKGYRIDTAHLGKGERPSPTEQCPLLEELGVLAKHWRGRAFILIDDLRNVPAEGSGKKDFAFLGEDWSHLTRQKILAALGPRLVNAHTLKNPEQYFLEISAL